MCILFCVFQHSRECLIVVLNDVDKQTVKTLQARTTMFLKQKRAGSCLTLYVYCKQAKNTHVVASEGRSLVAELFAKFSLGFDHSMGQDGVAKADVRVPG